LLDFLAVDLFVVLVEGVLSLGYNWGEFISLVSPVFSSAWTLVEHGSKLLAADLFSLVRLVVLLVWMLRVVLRILHPSRWLFSTGSVG